MKEVVKMFTMIILNILLYVGLFIGLNENKRADERKYQAIVNAFEQVESGFQYQERLINEQNKVIEQYKRDCENITRKVIDGEW